ncbi:MAG: thermonuclease family protein [Deltaproteobacteria bacterium]|jgi:endonuclease YncB( thermonuclease family)|nr:thermonuclease family protein [Deltaproteobacteria bacterium]MBW2531101.1 thermonuclease family protein [Deltaproteobacteria bacterium]
MAPKPKPAAPPTEITTAEYQQLITTIAAIMERRRDRAEASHGAELLEAYHAIGASLVAQKEAGHAGYGTAVVARVAADLGMDPRTLHRAMAFARAFPAGVPERPLKWGHYRELLALSDAEQRDWYHQQAAEHRWSATKLREAVREQRYRNRTGVKLSQRLERPPPLRRPGDTPYIYKAVVERVVDGDTLLTLIDLGFQVHRSQRLRLASIDTSELGTPEGDHAKTFVEQELGQVDFVIIKTDKIDLYGRYVAHVFYQPKMTDKHRIFAEGQYLNQRLVEVGLARAL